MKKILLFLILFNSFKSIYSQETEKEVTCFEFPTSDAILDAAIQNISENCLQFKKLFVNYYNTLSRPEKEALGNAINNNNPAILQQYSFLNDPRAIDIAGSVIGKYQLAYARQKELFPHTDSATSIENLNKTIICCMEKLSLNSYNQYARVDVDCEKLKLKCDRKVDRDYGICLLWSGVGGIFSSIIGTPAAGISTFLVGTTKCAFNAAVGTQDCIDDYERCIKNESNN